MRHLALSDLSTPDLERMLAENETLFVEHKGGFGGEGFQVAKAICSFANGLGGWVLIGVSEGEPNPDGWDAPAPHELTDRVRQALRNNGVDPIPAFAATVVSYGEDEKPIGVVRAYESTDTPHVMGNGQVFVRSVAEDPDAGRPYRPGGVETQAVLLSLAERGRRGAREARRKLDPDQVPLAAMAVGLSGGTFATSNRGLVGVRAIPLNGALMVDWAVSERAVPHLEAAARTLSRRDDEIPLDPASPRASGLMVEARSEDLFGGEATPARDGVAAMTTDAAGVVTAALRFGVWDPPRPKTDLSLNGVRDLVLRPLLEAVVSLLAGAEAYGRALLELRTGDLQDVLTLDDEGGSKAVPAGFPTGAEISLPLAPDGQELDAVADQWRADVGRAAGYLTLRS
jgi:schlafen family protein